MVLPKLAVRRPVTTLMVFFGLLLFGIVSFTQLPVDVLPDIELPSLTVVTVYPGASAIDVEQQVSKKLEEVLSSVTDLKSITSKSKENVSFITMRFNWNSDLDEAASSVRDMLEFVRRDMPSGSEQPMIYKFNSSIMPILFYGVTATTSYAGLDEIIDKQIAGPLKKLPGVGTVMVMGQPTREIKISVSPEKMEAYNLSATRLSQALSSENLSIPGGSIKIGSREFAVRVPGEFSDVDQIRNMPLTFLNGKLICLRDVATVKDGFKEKDEIMRSNGVAGALVLIQKQSGSNTLDVANKVKSQMVEIQKNLPSDVKIDEVLDSSELVDQSIHNLTQTIFYAAIFVVLVVFLFLRNSRSSLIVILTIPFSLIVAFIFMMIQGYTINIFSLISLAIAIGMVVDNAIVVLENITRHIEMGERPIEAAIFGTSEMGTAITASTLTTIAVFLPMVFMGGLVGILFKQLAALISITLIASLVTALTLTPMLCSRLLARKGRQSGRVRRSRLFELSEKGFVAVENFYVKLIGLATRHRITVICITIAVFTITLWLGSNTGTDFIPEFDAGDVNAVVEMEVGTNTERTAEIAALIEDYINEFVPEARTMYSISGQTERGLLSSVGFDEEKNISTVGCKLVLPSERNRSAKEIADSVRSFISTIPEIEKFRVTGGSILAAALLGGQQPIEIKVMGTSFDDINMVANQISDSLNTAGIFENIQTTIDRGKRELHINVNREKAQSMGLNTALIALAVRRSVYGVNATEYKEDGSEFDVTVRYSKENRDAIEDLKRIRLTSLTGVQVPLGAVASIKEETGLLDISHESQQRVVYVRASQQEVSLGEATDYVKNLLTRIDLPVGVSANTGGQSQDQKESFGNLYLLFILGLILVFMVMASQFESLRYPFLILFSVPMSIIGIIWAFLLTGLTLSVVTFIGVIMMIGIVVNNGIVLVDYTNLLRARGKGIFDAVREAGRSRLRPVLMTAATTIMGFFPMAMSNGMGSEIWQPLGITCIGGLLVSTIITLIVIPVLYLLIHPRQTRKEENAGLNKTLSVN